jgi:hypothetical protein
MNPLAKRFGPWQCFLNLPKLRFAETGKVAADRMRDRGLKADTSAFDVTDRRGRYVAPDYAECSRATLQDCSTFQGFPTTAVVATAG